MMTATIWPERFPDPVPRPADEPFWKSVQDRAMALQRCADCGHVRYPAADHCPECLSEQASWVPVAGTAELVSWCTFHRQYLPAFPPPHTVAVGRLTEGPLFVAILLDGAPEDGAAGSRLAIEYLEDPGGRVLPVFRRGDA
jgi:uncharacterized protein